MLLSCRYPARALLWQTNGIMWEAASRQDRRRAAQQPVLAALLCRSACQPISTSREPMAAPCVLGSVGNLVAQALAATSLGAVSWLQAVA